MKEFNYKKVVLILTVLLIIQIIVYAITNAVVSSKTEDKKAARENVTYTDEETKDYLKKLDVSYADKKEEIINPTNLNTYYQDLNTIVSITDFQKLLYKLVNEGFPTIYNATKDKSQDEVSNFYKTDYAKINSCGIMDEENYFYTSKELINQIYKGRSKFKAVNMDYESITPNQNGYMTINFVVKYDDGATINMKAFLAEREGVSPSIKFRSNSELKRLFEKYQGEATPNDFTDVVKEFAEYAPKIRNATSLKSINNRKKYYNENKEKLSKLGITSENDFMNLAKAINNETLITDDFYNYIIDIDSVKELEDRYEVKVNLVFMSAQEFNLTVKIYKAKNAEGRLVEFKSTLYNANYSDTNAE